MTQALDSRALAERIQSGRLSGFQNDTLYEAQDTGFFGSIVPALKVGSTGQLYRQIAYPVVGEDRDWRGIGGLEPEERSALLDGIAPEFYDLFADANSLRDARNIRERALIVQKAEGQLANAGYSGLAARFITTAFDPVEVGAFALTGGSTIALSAATKASKLATFVRTGLVVGTTGAALEAYAGQDDPNRGVYESMFAGVTSGIFGGTIGAFTHGRVPTTAKEAAYINDLKRVEQAMIAESPGELTPLGKQYFANVNRQAEARRIMATAEGLGIEGDELREMELAIGRGEFDDLLTAIGEGPDPDRVFAQLNGVTEEEARLLRHGGDETKPARDVQAGDFDATARTDESIPESFGDSFDPRTPDPGNPDLVIDPANLSTDPVRFQKARFGFRAAFARSSSPTARAAGAAMVEDAVYQPGKIRQFAATTWTSFKSRVQTNNWLAELGPSIREITGRKFIQRSKELSQVGADLRLAILRGSDNLPDGPMKNMAKSTAKMFDYARQLAKRHGVRGFEEVESNPRYFPRIYNTRKVYEAINTHGAAKVEAWFAGAYKAANPDVADEIAAKVGKGMLNIIQDTDKISAIERMGALSGDRMDILGEYLRQVDGLAEADVEQIVRRVRGAGVEEGAKPTTGRAMRRTVLDELHEQDGLKLDDFVETNAFAVGQRYLREVIGASAEAEVLRAAGAKMGRTFETRGALMAHVEDEITKALPPGVNRDRIVRNELARLDKAFRATAGRALNPDTLSNELARDIRLFTHTLFNGTFGAASMPETGTAIASAFPQFVKMVPEFGQIVKAALGKEVSNQFIREAAAIHQHTLAGKSLRIAGLHDLGEIVEDSRTIFGRGIRRLAEVSDLAGLLEPVTATQRTLVTVLAHQKFYDIARGGKGLSVKRLATMGLDEAMGQRIVRNIQQHATDIDGGFGGKIGSLNIHKWEKDVAAAFTFATEQWSRRAIQDVNIGQLAPWMTHEWARVITQYRVFPLAAYENHLLNNISLHDAQAGMEMSMGMVMAGTTYVAQTYRQSVGQKDRDKFLEERLTPTNIMKVAFQRAGAFSLMPDAIDFAGSMVGADPLFTFRNTGLSRARFSVEGLLSNPAMATANSVVAFGRESIKAAQYVVGDPFGTGDPFTESDFRNFRKLIPLNRVAGIDNFMRGIERMFPEDK